MIVFTPFGGGNNLPHHEAIRQVKATLSHLLVTCTLCPTRFFAYYRLFTRKKRSVSYIHFGKWWCDVVWKYANLNGRSESGHVAT